MSRRIRLSRTGRTLLFTAVAVFAVFLGSSSSRAQKPELSSVDSKDRIFHVRYPKSLLVCSHLDGENPDVWSPKECMAEIPVCDSSGHAGDVLMCLAYPSSEFRATSLQAAAFSVSRLQNLNAQECLHKWARTDTANIHEEKIGGLAYRAAKSQETASSHVAEQSAYRISHNQACYELDVTLVTATDTAFAVEDAPRKITSMEREKILDLLHQALAGFHFLK